jgi:uncharacterized membrane protein YraQ (UPF0718 family)
LISFWVALGNVAEELAVLSLSLGKIDPAILSAIVAGACIGFLRHNFFPARIFMGDSGALVLGFLLSGIVQAWIPRSRMQQALGGRDLRTVALATGLGAASSSCSYAAVAIAKSMFQKGASLATAMAFQFASTNLVFEIGIVMWIFLGWQFTLAEFVGGFVLIALMAVLLRSFVSPRLEERALAAQQPAAASEDAAARHVDRDWLMRDVTALAADQAEPQSTGWKARFWTARRTRRRMRSGARSTARTSSRIARARSHRWHPAAA